jgi:hypothetical protein
VHISTYFQHWGDLDMTVNYQPVFVIGAARSGTKLLRDIIAVHPQIDRVPYDINFIWRMGNEAIRHDELVPEMVTPKISGRIQHCVTRFSNNGPFLIEKTVSNCLRIPFVAKVFPEARYIFLIRDGRDVIESSYRQWTALPDWHYVLQKVKNFPLLDAPGYALRYAIDLWRRLTARNHVRTVPTWGPRYEGIDRDVNELGVFQTCAKQWKISIQKAIAGLSVIPETHRTVIHYEDLVRKPIPFLEQVAGLLGIDPGPYRSDNPLLSGISIGNIGKGWMSLTDEQKAIASPYLHQTEQLLLLGGYENGKNI